MRLKAFFRLKVDATDRPEVVVIPEGNFYFSLAGERSGAARLLEPLVDPAKIFGSFLDFSQPKIFYESTPFKVPHDQITENKTPSAFSFTPLKIAPGKSKVVHSFFGHTKSVESLNRFVSRAKRPGFFDAKRLENKKLIESIKTPVFTATSSLAYDPISATYLARSVDFKVGDKLRLEVFGGKSRYLVTFDVVGKERISVKKGEVEAYKIIPQVKDLSATGYAGRMRQATIWITADEKRTPIRIQSQVFIGSVNIEMEQGKN